MAENKDVLEEKSVAEPAKEETFTEEEKKSYRERRDHEILDRLSKSGTGGGIFFDEEEVLEEGKADEELIEKCKKVKEKGGVLLFAFQYADKDGNLIGRIGGVEFFLSGENFSVSAPYYNAKRKNYFLNIPISVSVKEVDEKNKRIALTGGKEAASEKSRERLRGMAVKALKSCLDRGEVPRVWGRVISVNPRGIARVLLYDEVSAEITVANWRKAYTRNFAELCRQGAIYEFDVVGIRKHSVERTDTKDKRRTPFELFDLSRLEIEPNPFDIVKEMNVQPGDILCVKCMEIPDPTFETKNYFYGTCERLRGVEICARQGGNPEMKYKVGLTYNCKIRKIDEIRGILLATAFEYSKESKDAVIRFL